MISINVIIIDQSIDSQLEYIKMSEIHQVSGRQIAAARVLLGISQAELAAAASISIPTLGRMEASSGPVSGLRNNVLAVKRALEDAGAIFLSEGETALGGIGIRVRS